jgi:hypothetical protein
MATNVTHPFRPGSACRRRRSLLRGEVRLASNTRCAAQRDQIEARIRATQERHLSAEDGECTARRARIQARLAAAQCRFLLADYPRNRLQLSETLALPPRQS